MKSKERVCRRYLRSLIAHTLSGFFFHVGLFIAWAHYLQHTTSQINGRPGSLLELICWVVKVIARQAWNRELYLWDHHDGFLFFFVTAPLLFSSLVVLWRCHERRPNTKRRRLNYQCVMEIESSPQYPHIISLRSSVSLKLCLTPFPSSICCEGRNGKGEHNI